MNSRMVNSHCVYIAFSIVAMDRFLNYPVFGGMYTYPSFRNQIKSLSWLLDKLEFGEFQVMEYKSINTPYPRYWKLLTVQAQLQPSDLSAKQTSYLWSDEETKHCLSVMRKFNTMGSLDGRH